MQIRRAQPEDAVVLAAAEAETARTPGLLVQRPREIPVTAYVAKIAALRERGYYVVAEEANGLVGHAFLDPMELAALAHVVRLSIVVHPGHTGKGIGTAMLTDLLAWAEQHRWVYKVELLVRATNSRAIRLYTRFGFVEEGRFRERVRFPNGKIVDDIAMAWFPQRTPAEQK